MTAVFVVPVEGPSGCGMIDAVRNALAAGFARICLMTDIYRSTGRGALRLWDD